MVKVLDVPHATSIDAQMDDEGNVRILLNDENGKPFAGVVLTFKGLVNTVEDLSGLIDQYMDSQPDTIGPCMGSA
ncbi:MULTISPECIES: hypothetical protein [Mesorhizobium]|uniref:hypothetical protein n=1 Tax=Mesorhizobium TaxID=68287 RepID=UPI0007A9398D|nr:MULTISPECIES: hypothetical protein [Mesorhizobium]AMX93694.1 hypothetical protein A4R28_11580 [Mesorhizobium ciceri]MDF3208392.1 hypothetical protein [Mesorhizobium sp. LMG15046]MDF3229037.1 hypothetical protein [Mesorhizobium sp. DSM 30133]RUU22153.1 hypothetical protein EOC84_03315 [Mesorhizobium sp. Primo-B]RUU37937.1 hypothetical protein EOC83_16900 [Mesorhizobium sp. Primo-A]